MNSLRRSFTFALADSYLGVLLQLASTLIIARLLTPTEIGIFSVAAALAALASTFRDFGLAEYLIQERNLTTAKIRAALAANITVSWMMAGILFASSGPLADFYRQTGVSEVMRIQAINFLLIPFGAVTMAYFRREMNYRPILVAGLLANVATFVVATTTAVAGFSYIGLAWSSVAGVVVTVSYSVFARPKDFPLRPSLSGWREVANFGKHATGIYVFGEIGKVAPEAVIGRLLDMAAVGFFSRAKGLIEIFHRTVLASVVRVSLPYFAQEARAGQATAKGYLKAMALVTGLGWPFFVFIGVVAESAVRVLYGAQWMPAVPLAQILCLVAIVELPYWLATEVMIASGRIDQSNKLQFCVQGLRVISLVLVFPFGVAGACWGLAAAALAGAVISHQILHKIIDLHFKDVAAACLPSLRVGIISGVPSLFVAAFIEQSNGNYLVVLTACGMATAAAWLIAVKLCNHPFWAEIVVVVRKLRRP